MDRNIIHTTALSLYSHVVRARSFKCRLVRPTVEQTLNHCTAIDAEKTVP